MLALSCLDGYGLRETAPGVLATCSPGHRPQRRRHSTVQQLFHRLGGRISELSRSGDLNLLAACRVAPLAFRRLLDFELSKSWKRNLLAVGSRAHDALQHAVHNPLRLRLALFMPLCDFRDEFGCVHFRLPQESKGRALSHRVEALSFELDPHYFIAPKRLGIPRVRLTRGSQSPASCAPRKCRPCSRRRTTARWPGPSRRSAAAAADRRRSSECPPRPSSRSGPRACPASRGAGRRVRRRCELRGRSRRRSRRRSRPLCLTRCWGRSRAEGRWCTNRQRAAWVGRWSRMMDLPPAPGTMICRCLTSISSTGVTRSRKPGTGWRTGGSTRSRCATAAA